MLSIDLCKYDSAGTSIRNAVYGISYDDHLNSSLNSSRNHTHWCHTIRCSDRRSMRRGCMCMLQLRFFAVVISVVRHKDLGISYTSNDQLLQWNPSPPLSNLSCALSPLACPIQTCTPKGAIIIRSPSIHAIPFRVNTRDLQSSADQSPYASFSPVSIDGNNNILSASTGGDRGVLVDPRHH
jgi:hypothetical protein